MRPGALSSLAALLTPSPVFRPEEELGEGSFQTPYRDFSTGCGAPCALHAAAKLRGS